jgi:hypothetical protein
MAGKGADDRCRECGSLVALHFNAEGAPLGCPYTPSRLLGAQRSLQRVMIRVGKRTGELWAVMADVRDDEGGILVWNLTADEQEIRPSRAWLQTTRRPSLAERERAVEQLRIAIGPVTLVRSVSAGQGTGSAARSGFVMQTGGKRKRIRPGPEDEG